MPNVKSAKKRVKTNEKARLRNRAARSAMRKAIVSVSEAISERKDAGTLQKLAQAASSSVGKTARKGIIHKRKASRLQSRLRRRVNKALASSTPAA